MEQNREVVSPVSGHLLIRGCLNDTKNEYIGETSSKVPVEINKMVIESDFKISLGTIKPHEMTGFSGGAAIIIPGVASRKTIRYNHSLLFKIKDHSYKLSNI